MILIFFVSSCQVEKVDTNLQPFFDLNDFLDKELISISNLKSIKKKVSINGIIDEQTLDDFDLKKDLEIFRNANINKVAWLDKYEVDSTMSNLGQLTKLKYNALDKNMKTREFIVIYNQGKVNSISINRLSTNQITLSDQHLQYFPNKGFSVESNQKVTMTDKQSLKIEVEYLVEN